jgi:SAM-dependent methyltransferase
MFDIIRKAEYFRMLDEGYATPKDISLKGIQDGWMLSCLKGIKNKRIMEIGGGHSRILPQLDGNDLWNVDKFEGVGNGPLEAQTIAGINVLEEFIGDFAPSLPTVDIIYSISVIEHIPFDKYVAAYQDMARCLAPGGVMYHAVDIPLADEPLAVAQTRIQTLIDSVQQSGLIWQQQPAISADLVFESDMASNSDVTMWSWGKVSEPSRLSGPNVQIVTLKMVTRKPE